MIVFQFLAAKIVQGECNGKRKAKDFRFPLPSRRLFYEKTVQGECNGKRKAKDFRFPLPGRRLFYEKTVQGECNGKRKGNEKYFAFPFSLWLPYTIFAKKN